ncbi:hypothetical protein CK203_044413 [Vitis vinifera]|uniref:CCHC-type domain-containing protein n=1 Tax=Vitis vinifera TaxID=29760 RepID=A0A438HUK9_VITVI|nr:hypothetical protein CK203_044413 [Vitis vinifera]
MGNYFVCGKSRHHATQCCHRKRIEKSNSKANLAETEVIIVVVSSEVFMGNSKSTPVIGKGKVLLKLTFGKVLALNDVPSCARYPLELSVSISTWENKSEDLV